MLKRVYLNAAMPHTNSALIIDLHTENSKPIRTLIDSGSSHCFIDSRFAISNNFKLENLNTPLRLSLFDGSISSHGLVVQYTTLLVRLPCGAQHSIRFLLTMLDRSASAVLGYSWLFRHNLSIDWSTKKITIHTADASSPPADALPSTLPCAISELEPPSLTPATAGSPPASLTPKPTLSAELCAAAARIPVSFIRAAALAFLNRLPSSHPQSVVLSGIIEPESCIARTVVPTPSSPHVDDKLATEFTGLRPQVLIDYHDYLNIFSKQKGTTLPPRQSHNHHINLEDNASPPFGPIYSLSEVEQLALCEFLDENLKNQFIRPSQSSAGAPVLFIKKKDGSLRLAVDYRGLNKITKKDRYPLPLIPDLLDRLRSACVFTKLDLRGMYNLVRIADGDEWKTAFRTHYRSYEFQVMHYGLTNAPASFQRFMNDIFKDLLDMCVVVYLDDILIYSDNPDKHLPHVRKVLRRLRAHNLYAKIEKCAFGVDTTDFLGFIVGPEGLRMDDSKIQVIRNWPTPRKVKDVQSFLGFANFYRRFIFSYSDIIIPLTCLTRKDTRWVWSPLCEDAFQLLKVAFTSAPILHHFDPSLPPVVETDVSDYAIAGIFSVRTYGRQRDPPRSFLQSYIIWSRTQL